MRPRLTTSDPVEEASEHREIVPAENDAGTSPQPALTSTQILYLRTTSVQQGVLQLHKVVWRQRFLSCSSDFPQVLVLRERNKTARGSGECHGGGLSCFSPHGGGLAPVGQGYAIPQLVHETASRFIK